MGVSCQARSLSRGAKTEFRNYRVPFAYLQPSVYFGFNSDGFYDQVNKMSNFLHAQIPYAIIT